MAAGCASPRASTATTQAERSGRNRVPRTPSQSTRKHKDLARREQTLPGLAGALGPLPTSRQLLKASPCNGPGCGIGPRDSDGSTQCTDGPGCRRASARARRRAGPGVPRPAAAHIPVVPLRRRRRRRRRLGGLASSGRLLNSTRAWAIDVRRVVDSDGPCWLGPGLLALARTFTERGTRCETDRGLMTQRDCFGPVKQGRSDFLFQLCHNLQLRQDATVRCRKLWCFSHI